ncbi:MAG: cell division protein FtsL [Atopostipes sp.]|nr:cell division protein FtsL [Atopostipes sp.]
MDNNLAEEIKTNKIAEQYDPALKPNKETPLEEIPRKDTTPSKGLSKLEINLISMVVIILFGLLLYNVQTDLQLAQSSRKVQDLNSEIENTQVEIENLEQHVQELSRYDRIHKIAEEYGLDLHEENIRNLSSLE